ncbi:MULTISPECIES: DUF2508 family protein [unclassified Paenibacillus]|uniref:DUF2508 family protein n=1 Tax=unclassified Paenibacillus TaxID=185978 RepID=UPI002F4154EB
MSNGINRSSIDERDELQADIERALKEWDAANRMFNYAHGQEQIDYAIYALIACEKKYSMLLKKAKQLNMERQLYGQTPNWIERGE